MGVAPLLLLGSPLLSRSLLLLQPQLQLLFLFVVSFSQNSNFPQRFIKLYPLMIELDNIFTSVVVSGITVVVIGSFSSNLLINCIV